MKKTICFIIICVMLIPSCVCAEKSISQLIADYNEISGTTSAFKLSRDIMTETDSAISFTKGTTTVVFQKDSEGDYNISAVYAESFEDLISCSAVCGVYIVQDVEGYVEYLGWLSYMYFRAMRGGEPFARTYGDYTFQIEKKGEGYFFMIMKL